MAKMTYEEAVAHFKNRPKERENYTDIHYQVVEVDACEVNVDGARYLIPKSAGQAVLEIVENPAKNNEMIPLGNIDFRAYMVRTLEFKKIKFKELSDWGKAIVLEERPDLFEQWEDNFSPKLKEQIKELKLGSQGRELGPVSNMVVLE